MRSFYPEIEPYESGLLEVGDGQSTTRETSVILTASLKRIPARWVGRRDAIETTADSSTRRSTASCCSTSVALMEPPHASDADIDPEHQHHPGISSMISSYCGSTLRIDRWLVFASACVCAGLR
jgi:hypothetical protein